MSVRVSLILGDITTQTVDVVVNAANSSLLGGGGVDGAIHRGAGPRLLEACKALRRDVLPAGLPTGDAIATDAFDLPARWVVHTVGPVYASAIDPAALLRRCHARALAVADELGASSVAFPAISTGVYGYPVDEAAAVALSAVREVKTEVTDIRFVLFGDAALAAFAAAARRLDIEVQA